MKPRIKRSAVLVLPYPSPQILTGRYWLCNGYTGTTPKEAYDNWALAMARMRRLAVERSAVGQAAAFWGY